MPQPHPVLEWAQIHAGKRQEAALETRELANRIVDALSDHFGEDIVMLT